MLLSDEIKQQIMNFGALSYSPEKMGILLDRSTEEIEELMQPHNHFYELYEKGKVQAQYEIDESILKMAKSGDMKAQDKYRLMLHKNAK
jgi:hypothetical protein